MYFLTECCLIKNRLVRASEVRSLSAAASAISNVGPGIGSVIGPNGNYSSLNNGAKWILSITMLIGRLEIFTILVLLSIAFWKK